jgi:hypothetical protein
MSWSLGHINTYLRLAADNRATKSSEKIGHDVHISDFWHISDGGFASG